VRLKSLIKNIVPEFALARLGVDDIIGEFTFDKISSAKEDIKSKYGFDGDLLKIFSDNKGGVVHKWHHYIPIYDRYFSRFRGRAFRFLEIGVFKGGSLQMWRKYFGENAIIYGIDINPDCFRFNGAAGQVRIGSQDDPGFLDSVIREMGGVDVILDDGSHKMAHIKSTLNFLFPKVSDGGLYMIEDLHTAYWRAFGGGYRSKSNFFRFVGELMDDMHHWYHIGGMKHPAISACCPAMHIYDSIVVFEKAKVFAPTHSQIS
jgi:hypothetical protein